MSLAVLESTENLRYLSLLNSEEAGAAFNDPRMAQSLIAGQTCFDIGLEQCPNEVFGIT